MTEQQNPYTFGELKTLLKTTLSRGGDSEISDTIAGQLLNGAEQFIDSEIGFSAYWLEATSTFTVPSGTSTVDMDLQIGDVLNVRDEANVRSLAYIDRQQWNAYIVTASDTTGTPLKWTRFGFVRRTNQESPSEPHGQLQIAVWPVPTADTTLYYDALLRAGCMVEDDDFPVLPISFHHGLMEVAAWMGAPHDVSQQVYEQHERIAMRWIMTIKRDAIRKQGPMRLVTKGEHVRRSKSVAVMTRKSQLMG